MNSANAIIMIIGPILSKQMYNFVWLVCLHSKKVEAQNIVQAHAKHCEGCMHHLPTNMTKDTSVRVIVYYGVTGPWMEMDEP